MNYTYNNTSKIKAQVEKKAVLEDYQPTSGRRIDWRGKKLQSQQLADSFQRIGKNKKSANVRWCGTDLVFRVNPNDTSEKKLHTANFCKVRLCPMCAWRKSLKTYHQVSQVKELLDKQCQYSYLFLTLTVRNVKGIELAKELDEMFYGWKKLALRKEFKKAVKGWFRALEVTHNKNKYSRSYDTFHPHFHVILVVNKSYFRSRDFIKQERWIEIWKDCMKLDYAPSVDIRKADSGMVPEVAKYTVKSNDYIVEHDLDFTDRTVRVLDEALYSRRLIAFGGVMKKALKELKMSEDDDDLINTDSNTQLDPAVAYVLARYKWNVGYNGGDYILEEVKEYDQNEDMLG